MKPLNDLLTSRPLTSRLLSSKTQTSKNFGFFDISLQELVNSNSDELIVKPFIQYLAKREVQPEKPSSRKKPRFVVSFVQTRYFFKRHQSGKDNSGNIEDQLDDIIYHKALEFFQRIFDGDEQLWIKQSLDCSGLIILRGTTDPKNSGDPKYVFTHTNIVGCIAYFSTDASIFINLLASNTETRPNDIIQNAQSYPIVASKHQEVLKK